MLGRAVRCASGHCLGASCQLTPYARERGPPYAADKRDGRDPDRGRGLAGSLCPAGAGAIEDQAPAAGRRRGTDQLHARATRERRGSDGGANRGSRCRLIRRPSSSTYGNHSRSRGRGSSAPARCLPAPASAASLRAGRLQARPGRDVGGRAGLRAGPGGDPQRALARSGPPRPEVRPGGLGPAACARRNVDRRRTRLAQAWVRPLTEVEDAADHSFIRACIRASGGCLFRAEIARAPHGRISYEMPSGTCATVSADLDLSTVSWSRN